MTETVEWKKQTEDNKQERNTIGEDENDSEGRVEETYRRHI